MLGKTLPHIAREKAGIIKPNTPILIGEYHADTLPVFEIIAEQRNAQIYTAFDSVSESDILHTIPYQQHNERTVRKACEILQAQGVCITYDHMQQGIQSFINTPILQGRWQVLQKSPLVICDVAHNEAGIQYAMQSLKQYQPTKLYIVVGFLKKKDVRHLLSFFPVDAYYLSLIHI